MVLGYGDLLFLMFFFLFFFYDSLSSGSGFKNWIRITIFSSFRLFTHTQKKNSFFLHKNTHFNCVESISGSGLKNRIRITFFFRLFTHTKKNSLFLHKVTLFQPRRVYIRIRCIRIRIRKTGSGSHFFRKFFEKISFFTSQNRVESISGFGSGFSNLHYLTA